MRFDEVELDPVPLIEEPVAPEAYSLPGAPRMRRLASLLTDISLFVALSFVLLPLLPGNPGWIHVAALGGFVLMLSYYYFVGSWMLSGKTIGGAIFDVRVVPEGGGPMSLRAASTRWLAFCLSLVTLGAGFALAALPARRSLPDRLSETYCV